MLSSSRIHSGSWGFVPVIITNDLPAQWHCTIHSAHYAAHTAHRTIHSAQWARVWTVFNAPQWSLQSVVWAPHNTQCILHSARYTLHITHSTVNQSLNGVQCITVKSANCSLHSGLDATAQYTLHTTQCTIYTAHCTLNNTHCTVNQSLHGVQCTV